MDRLTLIVQTTLIVTSLLSNASTDDVPRPDVDLNEWWGPSELKYIRDQSIRPFRVIFNESMVIDLKYRLNYHRPLTPPLEGVAFEYGFNSWQLKRWLQYWAEEYPFHQRQEFFNQFPQYKTNIQGLDIHFIRVREKMPGDREVVPLLLLHGWPGSVREFYETIPYLLDGGRHRDYDLELIVPSLPGFGFSDAAVRPGLGVDKVAVIFRNLMHRLGHEKFYIQGGDFGASICNNMATLFPQEILGYHMNMVHIHTPYTLLLTLLGSLYPAAVVKPEALDRIYPLSNYLSMLMEESGYLHIQATKPDTVVLMFTDTELKSSFPYVGYNDGVGVSDSPAGLAAYVLEKFSSGTRRAHRYYPDGGLTAFFTPDQLIDNLMVYWTSNSMTTAMRLYSETFNKRYLALRINEIKTPVPAWAIQARDELFYMPPWMIRMKYPNFLNETVLPDGGHFLAFEKPVVFARNVVDAIDAFRGWHQNRRERFKKLRIVKMS